MYKNINLKDWTNTMSKKIKIIIKKRRSKNGNKYNERDNVMQPK